VNTANRVLWTVLGFLLTAAGAAGLAVSLGWIGGVNSHAPLWLPRWTTWWHSHLWIAILCLTVLAIVAIVVGLGLARRQLRRRAEPTITQLNGDQVSGPAGTRTEHLTIRARGISRGAATDLVRYREVSEASVALTGDPRTPTMDARLEVTPRVKVATLAEHFAASKRRLAATLGSEPQPRVLITIAHDGTRTRRVT
jgi:membrane protein implicated in regulation of membrane protease activity